MENTTIFLTGFPGFLGKRLLPEIMRVRPGCRIRLLVLEEMLDQARREAAEWPGQDVEVLPGDISREFLGLPESRYRELASQVTDVFHLAAIYDLSVPKEAAHRVNVVGTSHIVRLCQESPRLKAFVYYSTCYVAGRCQGIVREDELPEGQTFKNHYESTKHEAEKIVRLHMDTIPTIILRPSVVVGDVSTGETPKFDGPFLAMIMLDRLKRFGIPIPYVGSLRARVNIVPVNFVIDATIALWQDEKAVGKCYALADPSPLTSRRVYEITARSLGVRLRGKIPPQLMSGALSLRFFRKFLGVPREVVEYYNHPVEFDTANADSALRAKGIACPEFMTYYPQMLRFYLENKHRKELHCRIR